MRCILYNYAPHLFKLPPDLSQRCTASFATGYTEKTSIKNGGYKKFAAAKYKSKINL